MPYNDDWKLGRKMFTQHFRAAAASTHREEETRCSRELVRDILRDPTDLYEHVRLYVAPFSLFDDRIRLTVVGCTASSL